MTDLPTVPVTLRVHLAHATVQAIADECGAHVLHIKGPALHPSLRGSIPGDAAAPPESPDRPGRGPSVDADILVRPSHMKLLMGALRKRGWKQVTPYLDRGLIEHSTDWYHPELGAIDLHGRFPGIQVAPEDAFDRLWLDRGSQEIAGRGCAVPAVDVQRLILLLHAARDLGNRAGDVQRVWADASEAERESVSALASELSSEVALAGATGNLENYRDRPEYAMWRMYADGTAPTSGLEKLSALVGDAPVGYGLIWARVIRHSLRSLFLAPRRLSAQMPRRPTGIEVWAYYRNLIGRGFRIRLRRGERNTRTTG